VSTIEDLQAATKYEFDKVDPGLLFSTTFPDRTFHALHRTDSHASTRSHDRPVIIGSPSTYAPLLPHLTDVLNEAASPSQSRNNTVDVGPPTFSNQRSVSGTLLDNTDGGYSNHGSVKDTGTSSMHLSPQELNISPFSSTAFSPSATINAKWPVTNAWEAKLLHHFIVHCTNWIDVCDSRCHFAKEVPRRAAHFPVILNGILGLAARHLWLLSKIPEDHSQPYIDACLQALIVALEDPLAHWDENFLVAVCGSILLSILIACNYTIYPHSARLLFPLRSQFFSY
jgi:hypothetical protein